MRGCSDLLQYYGPVVLGRFCSASGVAMLIQKTISAISISQYVLNLISPSICSNLFSSTSFTTGRIYLFVFVRGVFSFVPYLDPGESIEILGCLVRPETQYLKPKGQCCQLVQTCREIFPSISLSSSASVSI